MSFDIVPSTADRFDDLRELLAPKKPGSPACWCLSYRFSSGDPRMKAGESRAALLQELCTQRVPPGLLAYRGATVVGWSSVNPRSAYYRLMHSRVIPRVDDEPAWSVICFVVRPGHRREGVATALLGGAVDFARAEGASILEGYPADNAKARMSGTFAYTGTRSMFEKAGFSWAADTNSKTGGITRVVMRRNLQS